MKIYFLLISCLCRTLAITVQYETKGALNKNDKEYRSTLKDIRLVPINQIVKSPPQSQIFPPSETLRGGASIQPKTRGDKRFAVSKGSQVSRVSHANSHVGDGNDQNYMKKMADQLYIAQKHASVLSDYQKFIIKQDPLVKNFVLGESVQTRTPKPFSRTKQNGRNLSVKAKLVPREPVTAATTDFNRIVVVTPKPQARPEKIPLLQNDYAAQSTDIKYVSLAPQPTTHFAEDSSKKLAVLSYPTPEPYTYYDLSVTQKSQIETVQVPATISLGLGSYAAPHYHHEEHPEDHYADSKYEFMYKVKDHEKSSHFGHMESRTDKGTFGYYFVHLPDGRLETVKYWADKTGYHAKVDYEGEAKHPSVSEYKIHSRPNLAHY